jgi:hypothetical protein
VRFTAKHTVSVIILLSRLVIAYFLTIMFRSFNVTKYQAAILTRYAVLRERLQSILNTSYLLQKCSLEITQHSDPAKLHLCCIVYNDDTFLPDIISKVQTNTIDHAELWIIDNSNNLLASRSIQQMATNSSVKYVKLPENPYSGSNQLGALTFLYNTLAKKKYNGSNSHGIAIDWVCQNIIEPSNIQYYGFIDHDIIPIKGVDIMHKLANAPFYGRKQTINGLAYLWPGFCFFNRAFIKPIDLHFLPNGGADTGSGNAHYLANRYAFDRFKGARYQTEKILEGDDLQDHYIEYIDDWLHVINASNWRNSALHLEKMKVLTKHLNQS